MTSKKVRVLFVILIVTGAGLLYFSKEFKENKIVLVLSSIIKNKSVKNCTSINCSSSSNSDSDHIIHIVEGDHQSNVVEEGLEARGLVAEGLEAHGLVEDGLEVQGLVEDGLEAQGLVDEGLAENVLEEKVLEANVLEVNDELSFVELTNIEYEHNHVKVEAIVAERMNRIRDYCKKNFHNYRMYNMYSFPELNVLWIPSFKAGSSTWRDFLIETIHGPDAKKFTLNELSRRQLGERDFIKSVIHHKRRLREGRVSKKSTSFMQVRHPIDRLISLHLSTAILRSDFVTMKVWGISAIIGQRKVPEVNISRTPLYEQELRRWVKEKNDGEVNITKFSEDNPYFHPPHPTFPELVAVILKRRYHDKRSSMNGHWYPATEFGDICQNNLNYIIKLENNPMETVFLLTKLNLLNKEDYLLHKHNASNKTKSVEVVAKRDQEYQDITASVSSKYEPWMKDLTKIQKAMLKRLYKEDFNLFNYDNSMLN